MLNGSDLARILGSVLLTWVPLAYLAYILARRSSLSGYLPRGKAIQTILAIVSFLLLVWIYTLPGSELLLFLSAGLITWELAPVFSRMVQRTEILVFPGFLSLGIAILAIASARSSLFLSNSLVGTIAWVLWPALNVAFLTSLFQRATQGSKNILQGVANLGRMSWGVVRILIGLSLFALMAYFQLIQAAWDSATDGVGSVFFFLVFFLCLLGGGLYLILQLNGTSTIAAAVLIASLSFGLQRAANIYPWPQKNPLTEVHASLVDGAVRSFHERSGRYPESLEELQPWYLPVLPQPVMFLGQTWCFEGGQDFYRLGYLYSEYFLPRPQDITIKIHAAAGSPPDPGWVCDELLVELQASRR